jgi:HEPN domain-containing protein
MVDNAPGQAEEWKAFSRTLWEALPEIDAGLAARDIPVAQRPTDALSFVETHMIVTNMDVGSFIVTEEYARLLALVNEWYRERYGVTSKSDTFASVVFLFDTPFAFDVPLTFHKRGEEEGTVWFSCPTSVQPEEEPLVWIADGPRLQSLTEDQRKSILEMATKRANSIRSICFDLRTVEGSARPELAGLAPMIVADLKSAAVGLRSNDAGSRASSGWASCQAAEKALKLYIRDRGASPRNTHALPELADHAEAVGTLRIDRQLLSRIPSGSAAVGLRYGSAFSWRQGEAAYEAALNVVQAVAAEVEVKTPYNVRNARFLFKTPPWFSFDTDTFIKSLKGTDGIG